MRELIKLPHVRQLQESSLGLSRGWSAGGRLGPGSVFRCIYTCFRDFEALGVDSQRRISRLPAYLPCISYFLAADLRRSGGVLWEPQETPRRLPGSPWKETSKEQSKEINKEIVEEISKEISRDTSKEII